MGSVPHLYTTGDNDPEIESVQYYRHYLYCDACGSFELDGWTEPENHPALTKWRRWLAAAATFTMPLVIVAAWELLGLFPTISDWVILVAGLAMATILWGFVLKAEAKRIRTRWSFFKSVILWLPLVALVEASIPERFEPQTALVAGLLLIAALLSARTFMGWKIRTVGMRCRQCAATYPYGSRFFSDLDANPRGLTLEAVPRPLGFSPFEKGDYAERADP